MKKLYIPYNGNKITYYRKSNGGFAISLPASYDKIYKKFCRSVIENDGIGWRITAKAILDDEDIYNVWITDEYDVCYNDSSDIEVKYLDEKLDPNKKETNPIYCRAQQLYNILAQNVDIIQAFEKGAKWDPKKVLELRKLRLDLYIKMLGYNSISDIREKREPSGEYDALSEVGRSLEEYKTLAFVKEDGLFPSQESYSITFPDLSAEEGKKPEAVITEWDDSFAIVSAGLKMDRDIIKDSDEFSERARNLESETFLLDMKKKVTPSDWKRYCSTIEKLGKLIMGLNYDLLPRNEQDGIEDLTALTQVEVEDKISEIIDSKSFKDVTSIEDRYVVSSFKEFTRKIDEVRQSDSAFQTGGLGESLTELKNRALATISKKEKQAKAWEIEDR